MFIPDYLSIGHVTRDLLPQGGSAAGGTALYAATTAWRLGLRSGIFTAIDELPPTLPDQIALARVPTPATSTFENRYTPAGRQQWLHAVAAPLNLSLLPPAWQQAPLVHLGPVLHECDLEMLEAFPHALVVATPQGWMRRWEEPLPSRIYRHPWQPAAALLRRLSALVLSIEDVEGEEEIVAAYARECALVALTRGKEGATIYLNGVPHTIPARLSEERDPTGAGDVFAAALLIRLRELGDPLAAARFAAEVAGASVEGSGASAIPTREQLGVG